MSARVAREEEKKEVSNLHRFIPASRTLETAYVEKVSDMMNRDVECLLYSHKALVLTRRGFFVCVEDPLLFFLGLLDLKKRKAKQCRFCDISIMEKPDALAFGVARRDWLVVT